MLLQLVRTVLAVWNPLRGSYPQKVHTGSHGIAVREIMCCRLHALVQWYTKIGHALSLPEN